MKVLVLGGGVIGVTTAYYLARAGHEVTVVDRQPAPALETSRANAGQISPGYSTPWAAPGIVPKAIRWMLMKHPPLVLRQLFDRQTPAWLLSMLRNCTEARYAVNKERMVRLATFSRERLIDLRSATGIEYDGRQQGTLQLFRTEHQLEAAGKDIAVLRETGVPFELLDAAGCLAAEPGLAEARGKFVGGLRLPDDETGDCFKFTNALAALSQELGVTYRFGETIKAIRSSGGRITGVQTDRGLLTAGAYVVALGSHSPALLAPLKVRLPVYPVKGYSITAPIVDAARAPESTVMDETYKIAITRLGDRIRVGGMAEIAGFSTDLPPARRKALEFSVDDLFAGAADLEAASFWTGLRPMTPDGTPVVGPTGLSNLFLNTGHGTLGWTMACGSAHVIADIVSGRSPAIEAADLALGRYR
ncbi:MAG: D-amino acid dehydrogenase [Sphingomonadales bacterium]|nr:MAG: D-amino acid dehydrogenase [Sphingomonadales bacterium]